MGRRRVLIVDDEQVLVTAMCAVLSDEHDVESVGSVAAARRRFGEYAGVFDVVLCDVQLPDGNAGDVREAYRAVAPAAESHFVLITGGDEAYARRLGGASPVLRKPFDLEALPAILATLVPP